jgi:hypothetical protein
MVLKKKDRKKSFEIIQKHHLSYVPEKTVIVTRTEHFFCGRIESYGKAHGFSKGFCEALDYYSKKYGDEDVDRNT